MDLLCQSPYRKPITFIVLVVTSLLNAPVTINTYSQHIPHSFTRSKAVTEAYLEWDIDVFFVVQAVVTAFLLTFFVKMYVSCMVTFVLERIWQIWSNSLTVMIFIADTTNVRNSEIICGTCLLLNLLNLVILVKVVWVLQSFHIENLMKQESLKVEKGTMDLNQRS